MSFLRWYRDTLTIFKGIERTWKETLDMSKGKLDGFSLDNDLETTQVFLIYWWFYLQLADRWLGKKDPQDPAKKLLWLWESQSYDSKDSVEQPGWWKVPCSFIVPVKTPSTVKFRTVIFRTVWKISVGWLGPMQTWTRESFESLCLEMTEGLETWELQGSKRIFLEKPTLPVCTHNTWQEKK